MNTLNAWLSKPYVVIALTLFFTIFLFTVPFSVVPGLEDHGPTWYGIDCSFDMGMGYALYHKLEWGNEIITTYGPLSFLSNRMLWGVPKVYALLFDLFILLNFGCVFYRFLINNHKVFAIGALLIIILLLNVHIGPTTAFILFFFALFWMYEYAQRQHFLSLVMSCFCICLCFYIKLNTALFAIVVFMANLAMLQFFQRISKLHLIAALGLFAAGLYIPSILFHVDLIGYIKGGFYIMSGFNEIMYLNENNFSVELWVRLAGAIILIYFSVQSVLLYKAGKKPELFYSLLCLLFIFLIWKQSVLRGDKQHLSEFLACASLIFQLGNVTNGFKRKRLPYIVASLVFLLLFAGKLNQRSLGELVKGRFTTIPTYFAQDYRWAQNNNYFASADKRKIPERVLQQIGKGTIDVFPWDVEYLLQNKLNYLPRPDFQSYMVYNKTLQAANYESYLHHPPQYILYDYDAIDERYPFNDEGMVNAYIAHNYTLVDTFTSNERLRLLLKRMDRPTPLLSTKVRTVAFNTDEEVDVSEYDYVKVSIPYSVPGKLRAFLYKPFELKIDYIRKGAAWNTYRTSPAQTATFIYTKQFIGNTNDFIKLLTDTGALTPVSKIKFEQTAGRFVKSGVLTGYRFQ